MATYQPSTVKKCLHCGNEFVGFGQSRYCKGEKCRQIARTIRRGGTPTGRTLLRRHAKAIIVDGKKQCKHCEEWINIDQFRIVKDNRVNKNYHYHLCIDCETVWSKSRRTKSTYKRTYESRLEERKKQAAKKGRIYNARKLIPTIDLYSESLVARNARDAFDWWFEKKTQEEKDAWYEASGKPWNNPRLSEAEQYRLRYKMDLDFMLQERMRRQIRKAETNDGVAELIRGALKRGGDSNRVKILLGYSIEELKNHIEKQFTKKMTWDKYMNSEIHIDHIIPKAAFDLTDDNEWRTCWGLPNLRPLWAKDNFVKNSKVMTLL